MKHLIIIGARGFGRELCLAAKEAAGYGSKFDIKGFLDSKFDALIDFQGYPPILGAPEDYEIREGDVFISALGDVKWRKHYVEMILAKGGEFITIVHKSANVGETVRLGVGCYIAHNAVLTADVRIGDHTCVFHGAMIGHDVTIGSFSHLSVQTFLGGGVKVGNQTVFHPGARVIPHKIIGDNVEVGIGSVVVSNIKSNIKVFGVPATKLDF